MPITAPCPISWRRPSSNLSNARAKKPPPHKERTIAPVAKNNRLVISPATALAAFLISFLTLSPRAAEARLLTDQDFKRISFVGRCEQNQWDTTLSGNLEIMMSAEPGESCEARLHFETPREIKDLGGLQLMIKGSRPKERMAIELVG